MKIALIGCGDIARHMHMPAIRQYVETEPAYHIAACCDLSARAAESFAHDFGIPAWYTDVQTMLANERPDAAVCLVRESANHEVGGLLLTQGIPTLLEKPPGRTRAEYGHLASCQKPLDTPHLIAFNRRYAPAYVRARKALASEPLRAIDYRMYRQNRREPTFETTAIHAVDAVAYLAGSPYARLDIQYQPLPWHGPSVANMFLCGVMQNGVFVTIRILVSTGDVQESCELHTDTRVICAGLTMPYAHGGSYLHVLEGERRDVLLSPDDPAAQNRPLANGFVGEHAAFADMVLRGAIPQSRLCDVLQSVELCQALAERATRYEAG